MDEAPRPRTQLDAAHVSLFVAFLSLATSMYQGYLNTRSVAVFSSDATRRETMHGCREAVEYFMEARLRIQRLMDMPPATYTAKETADYTFEARRSVARFAAVATYLANFHEDLLRERYTAITRELDSLIDNASKGGALAGVDERFYALNEDCVASFR